MNWRELSELAATFPEAQVEPAVIRLRGTVIARPVEAERAVLLAVPSDAERDRVIASDTETFFITPRFRDLTAVLARSARLDMRACRDRLNAMWKSVAPELAVPQPAVRVAHCYWLALWTDVHTEKVRRRFLRFPANSLVEFLEQGWATVTPSDFEWPPRLKKEERFDFARMFSAVFEDGEPAPKTRDDVFACARDYFDADAEPHFIHGATDDDEGTEIEYFMFDDAFLATPDVLDRLPNPDRGAKRDDEDDRYRALIDKLRRKKPSSARPR